MANIQLLDIKEIFILVLLTYTTTYRYAINLDCGKLSRSKVGENFLFSIFTVSDNVILYCFFCSTNKQHMSNLNSDISTSNYMNRYGGYVDDDSLKLVSDFLLLS